jgi:hypothetical protein
VAKKFGLPMPIPEIVLQADDIVLAAEGRDLMPPNFPIKAEKGAEPKIKPVKWEKAALMFLNRYKELTK